MAAVTTSLRPFGPDPSNGGRAMGASRKKKVPPPPPPLWRSGETTPRSLAAVPTPRSLSAATTAATTLSSSFSSSPVPPRSLDHPLVLAPSTATDDDEDAEVPGGRREHGGDEYDGRDEYDDDTDAHRRRRADEADVRGALEEGALQADRAERNARAMAAGVRGWATTPRRRWRRARGWSARVLPLMEEDDVPPLSPRFDGRLGGTSSGAATAAATSSPLSMTPKRRLQNPASSRRAPNTAPASLPRRLRRLPERSVSATLGEVVDAGFLAAASSSSPGPRRLLSPPPSAGPTMAPVEAAAKATTMTMAAEEEQEEALRRLDDAAQSLRRGLALDAAARAADGAEALAREMRTVAAAATRPRSRRLARGRPGSAAEGLRRLLDGDEVLFRDDLLRRCHRDAGNGGASTGTQRDGDDDNEAPTFNDKAEAQDHLDEIDERLTGGGGNNHCRSFAFPTSSGAAAATPSAPATTSSLLDLSPFLTARSPPSARSLARELERDQRAVTSKDTIDPNARTAATPLPDTSSLDLSQFLTALSSPSARSLARELERDRRFVVASSPSCADDPSGSPLTVVGPSTTQQGARPRRSAPVVDSVGEPLRTPPRPTPLLQPPPPSSSSIREDATREALRSVTDLAVRLGEAAELLSGGERAVAGARRRRSNGASLSGPHGQRHRDDEDACDDSSEISAREALRWRLRYGDNGGVRPPPHPAELLVAACQATVRAFSAAADLAMLLACVLLFSLIAVLRGGLLWLLPAFGAIPPRASREEVTESSENFGTRCPDIPVDE